MRDGQDAALPLPLRRGNPPGSARPPTPVLREAARMGPAQDARALAPVAAAAASWERAVMDTGRVVGRDDVTVGDVFDIQANTIAQVNMLETVIAMLAAVALGSAKRYETPPPDDLVDNALDCLADSLEQYDKARRDRDVAITFLNSPE